MIAVLWPDLISRYLRAHHGQVGLPTGRGEGSRDVLFLAVRALHS